MKRSVLLTSIFALVFSATISPAALAADWPVGASYFEGASVGYGNLIPETHLGSNSLLGSVMPNWHSTQTTRGTGGAGAVGTRALGIHSGTNPTGTDADNRTRKQALFCFLQRKNGVSASNRHASCTGPWPATTDWERTGSAVIVHQMLDKAWGSGSRTISGTDWTELYDRLVENDALMMNREEHSWRYNTAGVFAGSAYDAVKWEYDTDFNVDSWIFRVNGAKVYGLEVICANPLGNFDGLPDYDPAEYGLTPTASVDKDVVEADDRVRVTNTVSNGGPDPSEPTLWRLTRMVFDPGTVLNNNARAARDSASDPCASFTSGGRSACDTVQNVANVIFNPGNPRTSVYPYDVPVDMPVGTKICFTASVSRPTQESSPVWRHSRLQCIKVGKKPKVQVWGGDIRTGGMIDTSTSTINSLNSTYGSWGEYGVLSSEINSALASGAGLNNGSDNSAQSSWSTLTFANTGGGSGCSFGCYNFALGSGGLVSQFVRPTTPVLSGTVNLNSVSSGTYRAGNVTISGNAISARKTIVIVATGTVTIAGNITYQNVPYTNIGDIPQVIIKARNINIRNAARQVDAWLLAVNPGADGISNTDDDNGTLNTCSNVGVTANLAATLCNNQLVVNGPVVADIVYLRRTAGSDSQADQRGEPAEIFNLRADAYLWASAYGAGRSGVQTVYTKELSPRF